MINKVNNYEHYRKYSEYTYRTSGFKRLDFIVDVIRQRKKNCKVLEIGCGNGNISSVIAGYGYNVSGIDLDEECIRYANELKNKNGLRNLTFGVQDAYSLRSLNQHFDVIICSEVLEHLDNPEIILKTIDSLLSEDGIAIITIPNGYGPYELVNHVLRPFSQIRILQRLYKSVNGKSEQSLNECEGSKHVQFFTLRRFSSLCKDNGLQIMFRGSSDFISGTFPLKLVLQKSDLLCKIDFFIADNLPPMFASGWYFALRKKKDARSSDEAMLAVQPILQM